MEKTLLRTFDSMGKALEFVTDFDSRRSEVNPLTLVIEREHWGHPKGKEFYVEEDFKDYHEFVQVFIIENLG